MEKYMSLKLLGATDYGEVIENPTFKSTNRGDEKLIKVTDWIKPEDMNSDEKVLKHPIFEQAFSEILKKWKPRSNVAFLSLCTATRPYSKSQKYAEFMRRFGEHVDFIVVSNGGFIPPAYWSSFPFLNYDAMHDDTGAWDYLYQTTMYHRILRFFSTFKYEYVIANFRPSLRNHRPARIGLKKMKKEGKIKDYVIIPEQELYDRAAADGWRGGNGAGAMFPDLHLFVISALDEQVKKWSNYQDPTESLF